MAIPEHLIDTVYLGDVMELMRQMILHRLRTGRIQEEYRLIKRTVRSETLAIQPALWNEP